MNRRQAEILLRRQAILLQVAAQRAEAAQALRPFETPLRLIDTALAAGRFIRAHPLLAALAAGALVVARRHSPKGLSGTVLRLWGIYRLLRD